MRQLLEIRKVETTSDRGEVPTLAPNLGKLALNDLFLERKTVKIRLMIQQSINNIELLLSSRSFWRIFQLPIRRQLLAS